MRASQDENRTRFRYRHDVDALVTIEGLEVAYGPHVALTGVDLDLLAASTLAVIGPNGSGKSTLLHAVTGLAEPRTGRVLRSRASVALVLQSTDVDRSVPITVRDTVAMARYATLGMLKRFRPTDRDAVDRALDRLGIADLADRQLHDLSGGQRQRVLVAQGLAQEADALLLDEPVTGVDLVSREMILGVIAEERDAGRSVVMTTHSLEDARRCDRVLLLATRPIALGTPDQVLREDHLRSAFGGRVLRVGDDFVMDDPHHVH